MRQLELFAADQVMVRLGFEALERLDVEGALEVFRELGKFEDVENTAREAVAACERWQALELEAEGLEPMARAERLWSALEADGPVTGKARISLRKGLAASLADQLADHGIAVGRNGLCCGSLLSEIGRWREAEAWYRHALTQQSGDVVLRRQLGDLLWRTKRRQEARAEYQRALLEAPADMPLLDLPDAEVASIVERYGAEMAPVYGWVARVFQVPEWQGLPESQPASLLRLLEEAETARRQGRHDDMVALRTKLMAEAPEVFTAYMRRL